MGYGVGQTTEVPFSRDVCNEMGLPLTGAGHRCTDSYTGKDTLKKEALRECRKYEPVVQQASGTALQFGQMAAQAKNCESYWKNQLKCAKPGAIYNDPECADMCKQYPNMTMCKLYDCTRPENKGNPNCMQFTKPVATTPIAPPGNGRFANDSGNVGSPGNYNGAEVLVKGIQNPGIGGGGSGSGAAPSAGGSRSGVGGGESSQSGGGYGSGQQTGRSDSTA